LSKAWKQRPDGNPEEGHQQDHYLLFLTMRTLGNLEGVEPKHLGSWDEVWNGRIEGVTALNSELYKFKRKLAYGIVTCNTRNFLIMCYSVFPGRLV
jgi:hypothetical protein